MSGEASHPDLVGVVKKVLSGDTVIIRGEPTGRAPDEWTRSLAFLNVPRLAKKPQPGSPDLPKPDESYAWEAREFLRKKLVGKKVIFKYVYENKSNASTLPPRECGVLLLGEEIINETVVSEGYANVTARKGFEGNEYLVRLLQLEKDAIENGKGKHSGKEATLKREVVYEVADPSVFERKTFQGIVDDVLDGSSLRIFIETEPSKYQLITVMISGIRCPSFRKDDPNGEEFAKEAKYYTECCVLHKDVEVRLDQANNNKRFYGTVTSENRDLAKFLLEKGFAKILPQSFNASVNIAALRAAEREAKQKRLRLFKDYVETPVDTKGKIYEVTEIINGDAIKVKDLKTNTEKKIFLSSIRPPPKPENITGKLKPLYDVPCMFEAREYLRKHLIGKKVQVVFDYTQNATKAIDPSKPDFPEKECCTVFLGDNKNIAEALVAKGLASVVRHRQNDPSKSHCYDALFDAELKAIKSKRGIHGNPAPMRVVDLSNDASKAKNYYTFLHRGSEQTRVDAVVEYVYSSSRVKVYIPKENCLINLILGGITSPKTNEKVAYDGLDFVRSTVHQRDVQVSVEAMDKVGNFIGYLYFEDKNISLELLRRGLVELRDAKSNQFIDAEREAKEKQLNLWKDFKETVEVKEADDDEETPEVIDEKASKKEKRDEVVITHVSPQMTSVYVQYVANGPKLDTLLSELREELESNPPLPGSNQVRKGEIIAARFSADGLWYRGKVEKIVDNKSVSILFIDYGNRENVLFKDIAILPSTKYGVNEGPSPAKECGLAFVEFPTDIDQLDEAYSAFSDDTRDKVLHMKREYTDPVTNLDCVTFQIDGKDVVMNLVADGYILVEKKRRERRLDKIFSEYKAAQDAAKRKRLNLWQYGDFTEDDAKEFGTGKK